MSLNIPFRLSVHESTKSRSTTEYTETTERLRPVISVVSKTCSNFVSSCFRDRSTTEHTEHTEVSIFSVISVASVVDRIVCDHADFIWAAFSSPSSAIEISRIRNFWIFPVTVIGNSVVKRMYRGIL
jgi:hypothetical protein